MFKLVTPFRMIIAGSSGSGKSSLVSTIVEDQNRIMTTPLDAIVYCAKYETSIPMAIREHKLLTFHQGVPTEEMTRNDENKNLLFILDDLLETAFSSEVFIKKFINYLNLFH